jgi:hypothetical protein
MKGDRGLVIFEKAIAVLLPVMEKGDRCFTICGGQESSAMI